MKKTRAIDMSQVKVSYIESAPPITDWLKYRLKNWIKRKYSEDVDVKFIFDSTVQTTS